MALRWHVRLPVSCGCSWPQKPRVDVMLYRETTWKLFLEEKSLQEEPYAHIQDDWFNNVRRAAGVKDWPTWTRKREKKAS